ncbi:hypothetical protein pEaSNUABM37_00166 [Erwinia phage pEa_SNUABM_37]|nr:hypothetical protein pEaSNUABM37_00166 [Erwinia phage pEa_SNUABM_37]QXO10636.1 hypothetical protein pEaSNUABM48_00166 [Erwinia phage pEa_SNUABM_48]
MCGVNTKSAVITASDYNPAQGATVTFTVLTSGIGTSERIYWSVTTGSDSIIGMTTTGSGFHANGKFTFTITIPYNTENDLKTFSVGVGLTLLDAASSTTSLSMTDVITIKKMVVQVGQQLFANTALNTTFTVPNRTSNISVVCVGRGQGGGGGLGYRITLPVTPGETLTVIIDSTSTRLMRGAVTLCSGNAGGPSNGGNGGKSAATVNDGGGNGGSQSDLTTNGNHVLCGGGAGGYSGNGGKCTNVTAGNAGAGGGGGSGYSNTSTTSLYQAGGVGVLGAGANGSPGLPGSGGSGRNYGGGNTYMGSSSTLSMGACRIIWGTNRAYPSTGTADQTTVN